MRRTPITSKIKEADPKYLLLTAFMLLLFVAGGASRADAVGQAVVRAGSFAVLSVICMTGWSLHVRRQRALYALLVASIALACLQLVPLPPSIWTQLPAREVFAELPLTEQPWRPISISPDATLNSLFSLSVPLAMLALLSTEPKRDERRTVLVLIGFALLGAIVSIAQLTRSWGPSTLVNDSGFTASGMFANRNHQALLLVIGLFLIPFWVALSRKMDTKRLAVAAGAACILSVMIFVTGSRAGLALAVVAVILSAVFTGRQLRERVWRTDARGTWIGLLALILIIVALTAALFASGRAEALNRLLIQSADMDSRLRAWPIAWQVAWEAFPVGFGFGTFDNAFRIFEPDALLKPTYFNQAHNDLLQVLLEGGAAGALILVIALTLVAKFLSRAMAARTDAALLGRAGAGVILLMALASFVDYPLRTPFLMATLIIASFWMLSSVERQSKSDENKRSGRDRL